jgi:hypothetical protein
MRFLLISVLLIAIAYIVIKTSSQKTQQPAIENFANTLKTAKNQTIKKTFNSKTLSEYSSFINNPKIEPFLKDEYNKLEIDKLEEISRPARDIKIKKTAWGSFIAAASFENPALAKDTNYDAIWLRDSLWGYMALRTETNTSNEAKEILITLIDYISSQEDRIKTIIKNPALLNAPDGQMQAIHIRFNLQSSDFEDVLENGKPQNWNHKQNDALGLLLDQSIDAIRDGLINIDDLKKNNRLDSLIYLSAYLDAVKFYSMEDSGAWEESQKLNSSSISLALSAFENLLDLLNQNSTFSLAFKERAKTLNLSKTIETKNIEKLISEGYKVLKKQIEHGGESPLYKKDDNRFRTADAALLNIIYPAKLKGLSFNEKAKVLEIVKTLSGDYGIKRYEGDDYQAANFWFKSIKTDLAAESLQARKQNFIPSSEAQWFFDSWFSICSLILYDISKDSKYLDYSFKYTNRALGQITGKKLYLANGFKAPYFCLPESYNTLIIDDKTYILPSPICPLNWSKASMTLMFNKYKSSLIQ